MSYTSHTHTSRKGFTLIELVVTIVVLGLLAAIASVSYSAFLSDARGEIAAIEAAQDDRIAAAHDLLNSVGTPGGGLALSYSSSVFSLASTNQTIAPTVSGGTATSFSYAGTLPTGVTFDAATGVFTGPSAWNTEATQVVSSMSHSCALLSNGTVKCWGANWDGQLGDGSTTERSTPVTVAGIAGAVAIDTSHSHTCVVLSDGTAKCWGANWNGELGNGTTTASLVPVSVSGLSGATAITVGSTYSCALLSNGTVKCWGVNWNGQLGDGTTDASSTPVTVSGISNAVAVKTGLSHTCALLSDGTVKCWGYNGDNQLGDGNRWIDSPTPVTVLGVSGATSISAGDSHNCAVLSNGTAKCWGANQNAELGNGLVSITGCDFGWGIDPWTAEQDCADWGGTYGSFMVDDTSPHDTTVSPAGLSGVVSIDAGPTNTCAALSNGTVKCWGANPFGQLGVASSGPIATPVTVSGVSGATTLAMGMDHICALLSDGTVECWGVNWNGQLGTGGVLDAITTPTDAVQVSGITGNPGWPSPVTVTAVTSSGTVEYVLNFTKN
jgi:prepilin-type N-terminal cleavage/methylation domain-containing protein